MKNLLFVAPSASKFITLFQVAKTINKSGEFNPIFYFPKSYDGIIDDIKKCKFFGISIIPENEGYLDENKIIIDNQVSIKKKINGTYKKNILVFIEFRIFFISSLLRIIRNIFSYRKHIKKNRGLIRVNHIEGLVLAQELVEEFWAIAAHRERIPTIVIPVTFQPARNIAKIWKNKQNCQCESNLLNRVVSKLFPHWVYCYNGQKMLRHSGEEILAYEFLRIAPETPWVINSGPIDALAVESPHLMEYYRQEGIDENKLVLTGVLTDDIIAHCLMHRDELRSQFYEKYKLDNSKPIILCSLPPNQFLNNNKLDQCEFMDYQSMIAFWMKTTTNIKGWNIVFKFHPRTNPGEFSDLKQKYNANIISEDTPQVLGISDLYVVNHGSATIRWAIAAGITTISYDVFQYHYDTFINIPNVIDIDSKKDFERILTKITKEEVYYKRLKKMGQLMKNEWGCLDGKVNDRVLELFKNVMWR